MILFPEVKRFIESFIEDIEKENLEEVFDQSRYYLNDEEFNQFYSILYALEFDYEFDEYINDIIFDIRREIINNNNGKYICIEDAWLEYSGHWFNAKDKIIDEFDDFECDIINGKHWCEVYR